MASMEDRDIKLHNGELACRVDAQDSPFVVIDKSTRRIMTGALVMFPGQDALAMSALSRYSALSGDDELLRWHSRLAIQWEQAKESKPWGSQQR